ncbi:MAG: VCBS repeat-containing protein [Planctomycetales bacterium]|nr:VCBS repeat-containing protein [Planctomycetales bacterium]
MTQTADGVNDVATADVDGDGDIDLLSASGRDNTIAWYSNDGNGNFTPAIVSSNVYRAYSVATADIDGDGDLDVVSASYGDSKIYWHQNDGNQNFTDKVIGVDAYSATNVKTVDIDGDGDFDVVAAAFTDSEILWYENDGAGNFTEHRIPMNSSYPYDVAAGDVDLDGDIDLVTSSRDDYQMFVFLNDGNENFRQSVIDYPVRGVRRVVLADLDADRDLDVLGVSSFDNRFVWIETIIADLGDAPASYGTLLVDDGATHLAVGPRLGAKRDGEPDASPSGGADGDGADEDGVMFGTLKLGQSVAGVNIELQGADVAKVDAWIDFNADGVWDSSEKILDNAVVSSGLQTLNYPVPTTMVLGDTYARVRLSSVGGLAPTGLADDGEVEDYRVTIREDVSFVLPVATDLALVYQSGSNVDVVDSTNGSVTLLSKPIATTQMLQLTGTSGDDSFIIDYSAGGFFAFPDGIQLDGAGGADVVVVRGTGTSTATLQSPDGTLSGAIVQVQDGARVNEISLSGIVPLSILGMQTIEIQGALNIGDQMLSLEAANGVTLGSATEFSEGTLQSSGAITVAGDLIYHLPIGVTPVVGYTDVLVTASSFVGSFASVNLPTPPIGADWDLKVGPTEVRLTLVDLAQVGPISFGGAADSTQRSQITNIELEFDGLVDVDADAFELVNLSQGSVAVATTAFLSTNPQGNSVVSLSFSGNMTRGDTQALVDGNYRLSINPSKIRRAGTSVMLDGDDDGLQGGDYSFGSLASDNFFALLGDADGDRDVDGQDLGLLAMTFMKSQGDVGFNSALDSDGDGDVDGQDYGRFEQRFLQSLPF